MKQLQYMKFVILLVMLLVLKSCMHNKEEKMKYNKETIHKSNNSIEFKIIKSEDEWKSQLSEEEYKVLRKKGTEKPGTGKFDKFFEDGYYLCRGCGQKLFSSDTKFDAHCGWPSFYQSIDSNSITKILDTSYGMIRTEVVCSNCGGHLGHIFDDGPQPTGLRYCINSVSLDFKKK